MKILVQPKRLESILLLVMTFAILPLFVACGDDDPDPDPTDPITIVSGLTDPDKSTLTVSATQTEAQVQFKAKASWTAYVEEESGPSIDGNDWISFTNNHGNSSADGSSVSEYEYLGLAFKRNNGMESRSAVICILCESEVKKFTVIQLGADNADALGAYELRYTQQSFVTSGGNAEDDGTTTMSIFFREDGRPEKYISKWRDYADNAPGIGTSRSNPEYYDTEETAVFTYTGNTVKCVITQVETEYPSGTQSTERSEHYATLDNAGRVTSGWSRELSDWDEPDKEEFAIEYREDGFADKTIHNWNTSDSKPIYFNWVNGNVASVQEIENGNTGSHVLCGYDYHSNPFEWFDVNWAIPFESELLDEAAGDMTRLFAVFNMTGMRSKSLLQEINPVPGNGTKYMIEILDQQEGSDLRLKVNEVEAGQDGNYHILTFYKGSAVK